MFVVFRGHFDPVKPTLTLGSRGAMGEIGDLGFPLVGGARLGRYNRRLADFIQTCAVMGNLRVRV